MSSVFSLEINIEDKNLTSSKQIIELLIKHNWVVNKFGKIVFLPFQDNDMYNWISEKLSIKGFYNILDKKEKNNEIIGVELLDKNSNIGINLIFNSNNNIIFTLDINRKYINNKKTVIDYNWYVRNILVKIAQEYYVRSYSFNYTA